MLKPRFRSTRDTAAQAGFALRPAAFRKILRRERMRADRCERPFSVLVFDDPSISTRRAGVEELIRYLRGRLRATDVVGQLDRRRLAIFLFDTDRRGAEKLLADIRHNCPWARPANVASRHTYPDPDPDTSDEHSSAPNESSPAPTHEILFTRPIPIWKRVSDVCLATASLIVFSPIMVASAVIIKLTSPGPVLFCQTRAGLAGRPFVVYKFRTMCDGAANQQADLRQQSQQDGPAFKLEHDPRVTWVGKYLRKTCIDEFPQFWNVLRGDMSIVGPRPLPLHESADCRNWQRRRLDVTPGMTCIWQVSGGMRVSFNDWMRMDLRYIRQRTLWHDFNLLLKTARAILLHRASR